MSAFTTHIPLKPFIAQWATHHFGNPITFPAQSVGNARIISVLQRRKSGEKPDMAEPGTTAVAIPYSKKKDPAGWNHISSNGKRFVAQYIEALFRDNMYMEMNEMCQDESKIQTAAYAWCEMHGVDVGYADTIRQRFYRERRFQLDCGIDLRRHRRVRNEKKC